MPTSCCAPDARVVVEFEPQSRIEGEIQQLAADFPVTELTEVVTARKPGPRAMMPRSPSSIRSDSRWRTSPRCAICTGCIGSAAARASAIDLIPDLEDPKDLFSLVAGRRRHGRVRFRSRS